MGIVTSKQSKPARISPGEWKWVIVAAALILTASLLLVIYGYAIAPPDHRFAGLVYAQEDGQSYLAKIRQGMRGEWLYTLAYTAEPTTPLVAYGNYLFLGHIAAALGIGPDVIFHVVRLLTGAILLVSLYHFVARFVSDVAHRRWTFLLAALGGGFGWITLLLGHPTPDVLVQDMFPFLSILANVHFPLALSALLWLFDLLVANEPPAGWGDWARIVLGTLILCLNAPYGLVIVAIVAGAWLALQSVRRRRLDWRMLAPLLTVSSLAAAFLLFYLWSFSASPAFADMELQDRTLSPPPWEYAAAVGLVLAVWLVAAVGVLRRGPARLMAQPDDYLLLAWPLVSVILIYLPQITQQRRFTVALFVPLVILAAREIRQMPLVGRPILRAGLLLVSLLTNFMILFVTFVALNRFTPSLFLTENEGRALDYLNAGGAPPALVLASPEMGMFIPTWTGQRVFYGHPVETINAKARKASVSQFFAGQIGIADLGLPVDYIFVGPRERALGPAAVPPPFVPVFRSGDVTLYAKQP